MNEETKMVCAWNSGYASGYSNGRHDGYQKGFMKGSVFCLVIIAANDLGLFESLAKRLHKRSKKKEEN